MRQDKPLAAKMQLRDGSTTRSHPGHTSGTHGTAPVL